MNEVTITLLKNVDITKPNSSKDYEQMVVTHQEHGKDKPDGKKIFDFATPKDVWTTLKAATTGSTFKIGREKDKTGKYWEWKTIAVSADTAAGAAASPSAPSPTVQFATPGRVGNWETPEERAMKQIYIVRQSSISNAIDFLKGSEAALEEVLEVAKAFENYVFGQGVAGLANDQPE